MSENSIRIHERPIGVLPTGWQIEKRVLKDGCFLATLSRAVEHGFYQRNYKYALFNGLEFVSKEYDWIDAARLVEGELLFVASYALKGQNFMSFMVRGAVEGDPYQHLSDVIMHVGGLWYVASHEGDNVSRLFHDGHEFDGYRLDRIHLRGVRTESRDGVLSDPQPVYTTWKDRDPKDKDRSDTVALVSGKDIVDDRYWNIAHLRFDDQGGMTYFRWKDENWVSFVYKGKESKPYFCPTTSWDFHPLFRGGKPIYVAPLCEDKHRQKACVVWGDEEGPHFDEIVTHATVRDGRPLYVAKDGGKQFVVWGDYHGPRYDRVSVPTVIGGKLCYHVRSGPERHRYFIIGDQCFRTPILAMGGDRFWNDGEVPICVASLGERYIKPYRRRPYGWEYTGPWFLSYGDKRLSRYYDRIDTIGQGDEKSVYLATAGQHLYELTVTR